MGRVSSCKTCSIHHGQYVKHIFEDLASNQLTLWQVILNRRSIFSYAASRQTVCLQELVTYRYSPYNGTGMSIVPARLTLRLHDSKQAISQFRLSHQPSSQPRGRVQPVLYLKYMKLGSAVPPWTPKTLLLRNSFTIALYTWSCSQSYRYT